MNMKSRLDAILLDITAPHRLSAVEKRLLLDIRRLRVLLTRLQNDRLNHAREETLRVYSEMLDARLELLNHVQLQLLSLAVDKRATG